MRWLYFLALALVVGGLGFRLLVVPGPLPPRAEQRFYVVAGIGAVGVLEVGIAAFLLRAEDALQLPFGTSLRRPLAARGRHEVRGRVHRDDPRLRARRGAPLPRLADRSRLAALACASAGRRLRVRALALRALRRGRRLVVALRARRLGAPLGRVDLGRRPRPARRRGLARGARAAAGGIPPLLACRHRLHRVARRRGRLPVGAAPAAPERPLDTAATAVSCSSSSRSSASRSSGARCTTSSRCPCSRAARAPGCSRGCRAACSARAPSGWRFCSPRRYSSTRSRRPSR